MENHGLHDACNRLPLLCSYAIFFSCFTKIVYQQSVLLHCRSFVYGEFKVTVQFESKGNGQNKIVSHMERSEEKL